MKLSVPQKYPPPSPELIQEIHDSTHVMNGFLYFHRIPNPTASTVVYSSQYVISILHENNLSKIVLDFTDRHLVNHKLRRLMLQHISDTLIMMSDVAIVIDGSPFRKMIIDFFVRAYLSKEAVNVTFWAEKQPALDYMNSLVESST